jgi:predicted oxidoreductase
MKPDRKELAPGLSISRILTGLWQVADQEKDGVILDPVAGAKALAEYAGEGFDTFDMADHYGHVGTDHRRIAAQLAGR